MSVRAAVRAKVLRARLAQNWGRPGRGRGNGPPNIPFISLFLLADLATRMRRGLTNATATHPTLAPKLPNRRKGYDIGTVNWARIDASGTPEQTLKKARRNSSIASSRLLIKHEQQCRHPRILPAELPRAPSGSGSRGAARIHGCMQA
jgi:hypothetical protein